MQEQVKAHNLGWVWIRKRVHSNTKRHNRLVVPPNKLLLARNSCENDRRRRKFKEQQTSFRENQQIVTFAAKSMQKKRIMTSEQKHLDNRKCLFICIHDNSNSSRQWSSGGCGEPAVCCACVVRWLIVYISLHQRSVSLCQPKKPITAGEVNDRRG